MKKIQFIFLVLAMMWSSFATGQSVKLLSLDQLDQRIVQGGDTVYIVNFWASWCAPCLKELPYFEELRQTLKNDNVKILLVSLDFKSKLGSAVVPIIGRLKLKNDAYLLDEENQQQYIERIDKDWSGALPATLFVNVNRNKRVFKAQPLTYFELVNTYQQIK